MKVPMLNELESVNAQFEKHVPYADAAFLVLKSHLVVEVRLLEFIKARVSPQLFTEIERPREGSFQVRLLLARALAERDEIPPDEVDTLWPAVEYLGKLRNDVAHTLEQPGSKLQDKMRAFIEKVLPEGTFFNGPIGDDALHNAFRIAAARLNVLLAIPREPLKFSDVELNADA